jgi:hypothetical protein
VAYILYREHTIVSSAIYDDVSGKWTLTACVSWQVSHNDDRFRFLKNPEEIFCSSEEAEAAGIDYAKQWVDKKLSE